MTLPMPKTAFSQPFPQELDCPHQEYVFLPTQAGDFAIMTFVDGTDN